jgi:hypothetical protein
MKAGGSISIWFFIGISLLVNGLLILASGIYELFHPPQAPVVLFDLHASVWWGALLTTLGIIYSVTYNPLKIPST